MVRACRDRQPICGTRSKAGAYRQDSSAKDLSVANVRKGTWPHSQQHNESNPKHWLQTVVGTPIGALRSTCHSASCISCASSLCTTESDVVVQAKLLDIHRKTQAVRQKRRGEQLVLALNRSDYMLDEPSNTLLQVSHDDILCASFTHMQILYTPVCYNPVLCLWCKSMCMYMQRLPLCCPLGVMKQGRAAYLSCIPKNPKGHSAVGCVSWVCSTFCLSYAPGPQPMPSHACLLSNHMCVLSKKTLSLGRAQLI